MQEASISVRGTDVKSLTFTNNFTAKPGLKLSVKVKNQAAVKVNNASPTNAIVSFKFEAIDDNGSISFILETMTAVSSSTYISDFEEYIRKNYVPVIQVSVNEKIRSLTAALGMNIATPAVAFNIGGNNSGDDDNVVDFTSNN